MLNVNYMPLRRCLCWLFWVWAWAYLERHL